MLQSPIQPSSYSLRVRRKSDKFVEEEALDPTAQMAEAYDDDDMDGGDGKGRGKSRRELPAGAVATLKAWLLSPEHFTHPYPTPQDQAMLMQKTGIDKKQLKNWFTNARRRIWKPMLKKQIEQGKITGTGLAAGVAGLLMPGMPAGAAGSTLDNPHSIQAMRVHYQQAAQQQMPQQGMDHVQSSLYTSAPTDSQSGQFYVSMQPDESKMQNQQQSALPSTSSLGTLPQVASSTQMSKTDSHAVLMELFARDQDLVRQATESARLKAESKQQAQAQQSHSGTSQQPSNQHPMRAPSSSAVLQNVPTLNSWPQFSSINSLNNLSTIPGVKSIASLSGADLASKGNVNKNGNLAQIKSMESMGKNDSYAFLEVFFGDRSSSNLSSMGGGSGGAFKGMKSAGDEDNEIGLSLEDESPQPIMKREYNMSGTSVHSGPPQTTSTTSGDEAGTLKRAYDDALAARGLISVSRSCERLTDLVLPAKIQRTLSQDFINKEQQKAEDQPYSHFAYTSTTSPTENENDETSGSKSHQYPGEHPGEPSGASGGHASTFESKDGVPSDHVQVPTTATCALCSKTDVDTQLRPCGHMYHAESCLNPRLQGQLGPPKCPIDDIPMQSAVLAVPTDEKFAQQPSNPSSWKLSSSQSLSAENEV